MINVKVPNSEKYSIAERPEIAEAIKEAEAGLGEGRILVRPSGTEALVRVMVEARDAALVDRTAKTVAAVIEAVSA